VELNAMLPDRNRYRLALLKHAYLAACLKFGVLSGAWADEIRRDLVAALSLPGTRAAGGKCREAHLPWA